jgi:hypothetical protein
MSSTVLEELDGVLAGAGDADDALRAVVALLARQPEIAWAGILFREEGTLVLGPQAGSVDETRRVRTPIAYHGDAVGELAVDGAPPQELLDRIATAIAPYALLGWDTRGEAWEP